MSDRDIIDQIDDVITWRGSRDAMVWTADPAASPAVRLAVDAEGARQAFARLGEQVQAFREAFRPVAEEIERNLAAMTKAFAGIGNMPQMRELSVAQRLQRRTMKTEYNRRRGARGRRR